MHEPTSASCGHDCCGHCSCADKPTLILRLAAGIVLILHGYGKLFGGLAAFMGMLTKIGFPLPSALAWAVAILEFFGGIAILLGWWTRRVAWLLVAEFVIIILFVKKFAFPLADTDLLMLGIALTLALMGAGSMSLDAKTAKNARAEKKTGTASTIPTVHPEA